MDIETMRTMLRNLADRIEGRLNDEKANRQLIAEYALNQLRELHGPAPEVATVILFNRSGNYYTEEEWRIPVNVTHDARTRRPIGPYDMDQSPDFRRIDGGAVLVPTQEPWGYPHFFPGESQ